MTATGLFDIYQGIATPSDDTGAPLFAVKPVPDHASYFVGRDNAGLACLLVSTTSEDKRTPPPIRFESLDAQFELACQVRHPDGQDKEGLFTAIRCRSPENETIRFFLSVCQVIMRHLGEAPAQTVLAAAVQRIASIFQSIKRPSTRSLNGLFGELFVISCSRSPAKAVAAWRIDETSRFDFSTGDARMDVKSCAGRVRTHIFSYEQCNPPPNTKAVVASLMTERIPNGVSITDLITSIESHISGNIDLVLKLHDIVSSTLGDKLSESLPVTFDQHLAKSSLEFFDLCEIPAIRGPIPPNVSDVRFSVDLSGLVALNVETLTDQEPYFWDLVPED